MADARADAASAMRISRVADGASAPPARVLHGSVADAITRSSETYHNDTGNSSDNQSTDDDAALVALKYSLAQNELREMVHALYSTLEAREQLVDASRKEAAQVKEKHERWKQEARLEREQARQQLQQYQHDLTWINQQVQQAQMQKGEIDAENRWLKTQLGEKDKTIDQLNQQLTELISRQREGCHSGSILSNELKQVAADFSRKEREVYNNMLYAECRAFVEESRSPPLLVAKQSNTPIRDGISRLEQENEDLKVENQTLGQRCKHYGDELNDAKHQITELVQENGSLKKLVTKFEQSAKDGTETIECLQDSLIKLCDQITNERHHHESALRKTVEATKDKEKQLTQDIEQLQQKIHDIENKAEANTVSMMLKQLETDRQTHDLDASFHQNKTLQVSHEVHREPRNMHENTIKQARAPVAVSGQSSQRDLIPTISEPADIIDDIEDIEDDEVSIAGTPSKPRTITKTQAKTPTTTTAKTQPATTMCRSCGEEPFGFMVKCQKCKDPFHAGCVKPPNETDESDATRERAFSDPGGDIETLEAICRTIVNHYINHNGRTSRKMVCIRLGLG